MKKGSAEGTPLGRLAMGGALLEARKGFHYVSEWHCTHHTHVHRVIYSGREGHFGDIL